MSNTLTATVTKLFALLGPQYAADEHGLLAALLGAWGQKLDDARADGDAAMAQLSILTASADWLDIWGSLYAVARADGESDDAYAQRLIAQTIRQRPQPHALEQIIGHAFALDAFYVRDLWPFVLLSDQWSTPIGKPLQVSDGQLQPTFFTFGPNFATVSFSPTHAPGTFGLWISQLTSQLVEYTLEQVVALLPLTLLSDQFLSVDHVSDGQLTTPEFGTELDTARHSLNLPPVTFPITLNSILALIDKHRAAGTKAVIVGTQLKFVSA